MSFDTLANYDAALKRLIRYSRPSGTGSRLGGGGGIYNSYFLTADPAGTVGVGATTKPGTVPTSATAGAPALPTPNSGASLYLTGVDITVGAIGSTAELLCRFMLYDRLYQVGGLVYTTVNTITSPPSWSARSDFSDTSIWVDHAGQSGLSTYTVTVTYTNQSGTAGQTTGAVVYSQPADTTVSFPLPLAAGDSGVSVIETVTISNPDFASGAAAVQNIVVRRRLCGNLRAWGGLQSSRYGIGQVPVIAIDPNTCFEFMVANSSSSNGIPIDALIELAEI